jgi:2-polyprenyl-3-methyl-5-hydroxy-6-metoxy-1,4-benzoquinol methylase
MGTECLLCGSSGTKNLGKRSSFRPLQGYHTYVSDLARFDREVYECLVCGFKFSYPPYDDSDIAALYNQPGYEKSQEDWAIVSDFTSRHWRDQLNHLKQRFIALGLATWREDFEDRHGRKPRFLDVGCGRGQYLAVFDDFGFEVLGIDLSEAQIGFVRKHLHFSVLRTSLADFRSPDKFDVILATHVVERVANPHTFFEDLRKQILPGGLILVETPVIFDEGREVERYGDIYHTLFFDHFTLTLLGAMHRLRTLKSVNVTFFKDSTFHIYVLTLFLYDEELDPSCWNERMIETLRSCYAGVHEDFCTWGRSFLAHHEGSLLKRGVRYLREHGVISTLAETLRFARERIHSRISMR